MWLHSALREIVEPLVRRAGTATAAVLLSNGFPAESAARAETAIVAVALVGFDLALSYFQRRK